MQDRYHRKPVINARNLVNALITVDGREYILGSKKDNLKLRNKFCELTMDKQ